MTSPDEDFASMLDASFSTRNRSGSLKVGSPADGVIVQITDTTIFVDVGTRSEAEIDRSELADAAPDERAHEHRGHEEARGRGTRAHEAQHVDEAHGEAELVARVVGLDRHEEAEDRRDRRPSGAAWWQSSVLRSTAGRRGAPKPAAVA